MELIIKNGYGLIKSKVFFFVFFLKVFEMIVWWSVLIFGLLRLSFFVNFFFVI